MSVSGAMALAKGALESVVVRLIGEVSEFSNKPGYKAVYFTVKAVSYTHLDVYKRQRQMFWPALCMTALWGDVAKW